MFRALKIFVQDGCRPMNGSVVLKVSELCSGQTSPSGNFLVDVYVFPEDRVGSGSKSR